MAEIGLVGGWDRGRVLSAGLIDIKTHYAETQADIVGRVRTCLRYRELDELEISTDCGLRRVPRGLAIAKMTAGFDPDGFVRIWRDESGREVSHTSPVVVDTIRPRGSILDAEARFVLDHTAAPVKVTLPVPSTFLSYWRDGLSDQAYPDRDRMLDDLVSIMNAEARALAAGGVRYLQLDAPKYTFLDNRLLYPDPTRWRERLTAYLRADRQVFAGLTGVTTGLHICRGNYRSMWESAVPYEELAEVLFTEVRYDRLLLEYDDARSGDFTALRFVPDDVTVVLGLVTTKRPDLEDPGALRRRIDEAARSVPYELLAISPQCGFASTWEGNELTADDQRRKLDLVVSTAQAVWSGR